MSYKLSKRSYDRLTGVKTTLVELVEEMIKVTPVDFGIDWMGGFRTERQQNDIYKAGNSQKDGYNKKSRHQLGEAIDFIPYVNGQIDRSEHNYFIVIGIAFACAYKLGIKIRSGANWDMDGVFIKDQNFQDLGHIEII